MFSQMASSIIFSSQGGGARGGVAFFQNIEIRVENCLGGLSDSERRPLLEFIAKLSDCSHFQSKAKKELLKKSFLFSINLMVS